MNSFFQESQFAGILLSLVAYGLGMFLQSKFKSPIFAPILVSIVTTIIVLSLGQVDYKVYNSSAKLLSWLLTPATVCLAIPLYEKWDLLKKNWRAVVYGLIAGTVASLGTVLILATMFGLNHKEYVTFLPKSITTAIGMVISEELGGYVTITVAVIIISGIFGNMFGEQLCKLFRINEPISKGLSIGASAHAMGTARAMEMGEIEGAMSSLAIAVSGIFTVILSSFFAGF